MQNISVVIITKNEAHNIVACILSAKKVSNDIFVVDSGSDDATMLLAHREGVSAESITWQGYGYSRNWGARLAAHEWILSLDADERVTDELSKEISMLELTDHTNIYGFRRMNYFGDKEVRHGSLAHDKVFRLYNRKHNQWNLFPVHEKLVGQFKKRYTLNAYALHFGIKNETHYFNKLKGYALLCAIKYQWEHRKFAFALRFLSPTFNFIKAYFFQLGFLDKRIGFIIARLNAHYTHHKYRHLDFLMKAARGDGQRVNIFIHSLRWLQSLLP